MHDTNNSPGNPPGLTPSAGNPDAQLSRELGIRQMAANIFNYTVGSGIFVLPAFAVLQLGQAAPLAFVACAVIMGLVVVCFAEAGSRVSSTGGPYAYVETALGPFAGFIAGCLVITAGTAAGGAVASVVARSILSLAPNAPAWATPVLIVLLVSALVGINYRGVKTGARVIEAVTIAKLLPLLAFVAIGVFFIEPANLAWYSIPEVGSVLGTAGVVIFAFSGIEGSLVPSGEVKNPAKTVPRAAFMALGAATLLYLAIQFVALGILGTDMASDRTTPLASAANMIVGPVGRTILVVGAVISMFGYLSANVLSEPRGWYAISRDGFLPNVLAAVHPRFHTPHLAISFHGLLILAIALSGTYEQLTVFANLAVLMLYFLCAIAAFELRRKDVRTDGEPFVAPGGGIIPIITCLLLVWLFYETVTQEQLLSLLGVLAIILVLYVVRMVRLPAPAPRKAS